MDGIVCVVDAKNFSSYSDNSTAKYQLGGSNIIVLNKTDLVSEDEAKQQFNRALNLCDIALPGVEDLAVLYGIDGAQDVVDFCHSFEVGELVVK